MKWGLLWVIEDPSLIPPSLQLVDEKDEEPTIEHPSLVACIILYVASPSWPKRVGVYNAKKGLALKKQKCKLQIQNING